MLPWFAEFALSLAKRRKLGWKKATTFCGHRDRQMNFPSARKEFLPQINPKQSGDLNYGSNADSRHSPARMLCNGQVLPPWVLFLPETADI